MIVVDVNILAYFWISGEMTAFAERALERDPQWAAPFLWRSEFRNILAGYLRRGTLAPASAAKCLGGAEAQMAGGEYLVPSDRVMRLVGRSTCSAYDCEYAALAEDLNVKLLTSDKQLLRDFPQLAVDLRDFC